MEMYKKEKMFEDNLEEFDIARYVLSVWFFLNDAPVANLFVLRATCDDLMKEYKACESPDYISLWVITQLRIVGFCWLFLQIDQSAVA